MSYPHTEMKDIVGHEVKQGAKKDAGSVVKLHIELSPPSTPPTLLSLLETFSSLRSDNAGPGPTPEELLAELKKESVRARGAKRRPAAAGLRQAQKELRGELKTLSYSGQMRSLRGKGPSPAAQRSQTTSGFIKEVESRLPAGVDLDHVTAHSHIGLYDSSSGGENEAPKDCTAGGEHAPPASSDTPSLLGDEESTRPGAEEPRQLPARRSQSLSRLAQRRSPRRRRSAADKEVQKQENGAGKTGGSVLIDAMKLAEHLLVGDTAANRLERAVYGGSEALTFPAVKPRGSRGDQAAELPLGDNVPGKAGRGLPRAGAVDWETHAQARAVSVAAMEHVVARHHKLKQRCAQLQRELAAERAQVAEVETRAEEARGREEAKAAALAVKAKELKRVEGVLQQERLTSGTLVAKLKDGFHALERRAQGLQEARDALTVRAQEAEAALRKANDQVSSLRREAQDRAGREQDRAAREQALRSESTRLALRVEKLERAVEVTAEEEGERGLQEAATAAEQGRTALGQHARLEAQVQELEAKGAAEAARAASLTQELSKAQERLLHAEERERTLEADLDLRSQAGAAALSSNDAALRADLRAAKAKVKWSWLIMNSILLARDLFQRNTDVATSTDDGGTCDASVMTAQTADGADFGRFWAERCFHAARLDPTDDRFSGSSEVLAPELPQQLSAPGKLLSLEALAATLSRVYTSKALLDAADDRAGAPRQSLPEFLVTHFAEATGAALPAAAGVTNLIASVTMHVRRAVGAQQHAEITPNGIGTIAALGQEERAQLLAVLPRLTVFARFLGVSDAAGPPLPREALDVFLYCLVRVTKGQCPLLPLRAEKVSAPSSAVLEAIEASLEQMKAHERLALKFRFQQNVTGGKASVDLDSALAWLLQQWSAGVQEKLEHRLAALFSSAIEEPAAGEAPDRSLTPEDPDSSGSLDLARLRNIVLKLKNDQHSLPSLRRLHRIFGRLALVPRLDARVFVDMARTEGLVALAPGSVDGWNISSRDTAGPSSPPHVLRAAEAKWSELEPQVLALAARQRWGDAKVSSLAVANQEAEAEAILEDAETTRWLLARARAGAGAEARGWGERGRHAYAPEVASTACLCLDDLSTRLARLKPQLTERDISVGDGHAAVSALSGDSARLIPDGVEWAADDDGEEADVLAAGRRGVSRGKRESGEDATGEDKDSGEAHPLAARSHVDGDGDGDGDLSSFWASSDEEEGEGFPGALE